MTVKNYVPDARISRDVHGPMEKNLGGKAREEIGVRGFREWNDGLFFFTYSVGYENVFAFSGKFVTAHQLI